MIFPEKIQYLVWFFFAVGFVTLRQGSGIIIGLLIVSGETMPHVIIDYSAPLEDQVSRQTLLDTAHQATESSGLFNAVDIRSRSQSFDNFHLGAEQNNFLHVTVKLLSGRSDEQKTALTKSIITALQQLSLNDVLMSCECVEIHNESYQRLSL